MKKYLRLYRKELRFLAGPGIALIVLSQGIFMIFMIGNSIFPDFYLNILRYKSSPPAVRYLIRPILLLFSTQSLSYMYGALFLYSVIHEHVTKSRQQLLMLPVRRWRHIAGKLLAVMTWIVVYIGVVFIISLLFSHFKRPHMAIASLHLQVITMGRLFSGTAYLVSLVAAGYVVGLVFRRTPYLTGTVTIIAVFSLVARLRIVSIYPYFSQMYPYRHEISPWGQVLPWFHVIFPAVAAVVILIPALLLYERFAEV